MTVAYLPAPTAPATPDDEDYRLGVLASLNLLDTPPEAEFDALVQVARHTLDCPMALITLVDTDRQWFKARCGLDGEETPREYAFCDHAIRERDMMVVNDATRDPRFADNPFVTGDPHVRFYAGVPIRLAIEHGLPPAAIGTICVIDTKPRILSVTEAEMLRHLARLAETIIRSRMHIGNALRYGEERRADAARLRRQHRVFSQAERLAGLGSWRLSLSDNVLEWSEQVFAIYGLPRGSIPPLANALSFYPPHARPLVEQSIAKTMETGEPFDFEADFIAADGVRKRVRSMGELELIEGKPVALIGVFQDITERHGLEQTLRRTAQQDALTGIRNRAGFNATLDSAILSAGQNGSPLALALIDLDGFKQVNDVHGHLAGDELLQAVAQRLESPRLGSCKAARLGGDEFALIVGAPEDCEHVGEIAAHVLAALAEPVVVTGGSITIGGSLGIAWLESGVDRSQLMHRADLALYEAKRAGKGVARFWHPGAEQADAPNGRRLGSRR